MQKQEQNFLQLQQMEWWVIIYLHASYSIILCIISSKKCKVELSYKTKIRGRFKLGNKTQCADKRVIKHCMCTHVYNTLLFLSNWMQKISLEVS